MRKRFWAAFTVVTMLAATIFEAAVIPVMGYDDLSSITPAGIIGYTDDADDISTNDTGTDDIVADVIGEDEPGQQESDLETGSVEPVEFDHVDETPDEPELNKSGTDITPYITI
ncbi:MAG: hypothetical protein IKX95_02015, partial [Lachnospiraceae bacterium]|nr:hypothetical protein [Lachnospiraceae bacterium]